MKRPTLWSLVFPLVFILAFGLTTILSTTPSLFISQIIFILAGIFGFLILTLIDKAIFRSLAWPIYLFCLFQLLLTYIIGTISRGSLRWIDLGPFRYQTSEFAKPLLIVSLPTIFLNLSANLSGFFKKSGLILLPTILVLFQPDLGSAIVIAIIGLTLMIHSGTPLKYPLTFLALFLVVSPLVFNLMHGYQKQRLQSFLDPYADPQHAGYNIIQATVAIGSGQIIGKGVRQGTQSHLRFLPERHTDFAFASFAEEFGFLGVIFVLLVFYFLLNFLIQSAATSSDDSGRLVCLGAFWLIFSQLFINIGMNEGILPVTGITLPFISYGGSSLISLFLTLGLVYSSSLR